MCIPAPTYYANGRTIQKSNPTSVCTARLFYGSVVKFDKPFIVVQIENQSSS